LALPLHAVGTDLLYAAITKMGGAVAHGQRGNGIGKIVGLLAAGSVPASLLTTFGLHQLNVGAEHTAVITGHAGRCASSYRHCPYVSHSYR
jgi:uncharacterized membrane protein YfcA